jgi:hypothetical protein
VPYFIEASSIRRCKSDEEPPVALERQYDGAVGDPREKVAAWTKRVMVEESDAIPRA